MNDLDEKILESLKAKPGLKVREIADELGVDKALVNSALYGQLKAQVRQDKSYRWYPKKEGQKESGQQEEEVKRMDTPLGRLCRYYLDCLSHDDLGGISTFAASKYGDVDYVELSGLPMFDPQNEALFDSEEGRNFLGRIRRDRTRRSIFLGYPVRLNLIRSRKGWEGFMLEPVLLFPFQETENRFGTPVLSDDLPQINFKVLRGLTNAGEAGLMEEALQLAEELGFGNSPEEQPDLDELIARLRNIRPDWDWQEDIDPRNLSKGIALPFLERKGIFNRAILISAEGSPFTKGLETELGLLQKVKEEDYQDSALGMWLGGEDIESPPPEEQALLEILPLNSEQRQAVRQVLSNPLTVITGPPGTGKSQVVSSILVNAAWQGKTVLFASKNNKAVDVVEARVNSLGPRPVLLRLGSNQYQEQLAQYLVSLLSLVATDDDRALYQDCEEAHAKIEQAWNLLDKKLQELVSLRNEVDRLEQRVEQIRIAVGEEFFKNLRSLDSRELDSLVRGLVNAIDQADKSKQGIFTRLFWCFASGKRFEALAEKVEAFRPHALQIGLQIPEGKPTEGTLDHWLDYRNQAEIRADQVAAVQEYFKKLEDLRIAIPLEELSRQWGKLTDDLAENSELLWQTWLRLQPARLDRAQRKLLGDYNSTLQMIISANDENQKIARDVFSRYYQLFPKITSILPCWAVTSLSARGRLPFEKNFFDLLIIDEASQCDIASALPLLFRAKRVVIIGDPRQLPHISTLSRQQDRQLMGKHGITEDCSGWSYSNLSLFDLAASLCRSEDIVALRDHHRSHADIIEFSNHKFYEGRLRVATRYDRLKRPSKEEKAVRWVDLKGKTVRPGNGGAVNEREALGVVGEIGRLLDQGYTGSIGVVSPFRAQANRVRDLVSSDERLAFRIAQVDFLVDTVHKFQGDERDVMIFSPVVSSGITDGALSFLKSTPNLFNVAITRARAALIVVGDKSACLESGIEYLADFAKYSERLHGNEPCQPTAEDLGPEYPPIANPELVSDWERLFYRELYRAGIRSIPQYAVEKYLLDLAVLDGNRRLDIEIDGERYHRNWNGELSRRDQIRNQRMMELGWDVMRFWVYQVRDDLNFCLDRVRGWQNKRN